MTPWILLLTIAAPAIGFVWFPIWSHDVGPLPSAEEPTLPRDEKRGPLFDPGFAAVSAGGDCPTRGIRNCSVWTAPRGCGQKCAGLSQSDLGKVAGAGSKLPVGHVLPEGSESP
jgi:hypothetical protein